MGEKPEDTKRGEGLKGVQDEQSSEVREGAEVSREADDDAGVGGDAVIEKVVDMKDEKESVVGVKEVGEKTKTEGADDKNDAAEGDDARIDGAGMPSVMQEPVADKKTMEAKGRNAGRGGSKKVGFSILLCALLAILGFVLGYFVGGLIPSSNGNSGEGDGSSEQAAGEETYKLAYFDGYIPGTTYIWEVTDKKVYQTTVRHTSVVCVTDPCPPIETTEGPIEVPFTKENLAKLRRYFAYFDIEDKLYPKDEDGVIQVSQNQDITRFDQEVFSGLTLGQWEFEVAVEDAEIWLAGEIYNFYLKESGEILVKQLVNRDGAEAIETYAIRFSDDHMEMLADFMRNLVREQGISGRRGDADSAALDEVQRRYLESMKKNDESLLDGIASTARLRYTVGYEGLHCHSPVLKLYEDGTYKYYYTFAATDEVDEIIPKTGRYEPELISVIEAEAKVAYADCEPGDTTTPTCSPVGFYAVKEAVGQGDAKSLQVVKKSIDAYLDEMGVSLTRCLEQQK